MTRFAQRDFGTLTHDDDNIEIRKTGAADDYGMTQYSGSTVEVEWCRVQRGVMERIDFGGETFVATHKIYVLTDEEIDVDDEVTVDGEVIPVIRVDRVGDERGQHHQLLWTGSAPSRRG